MEILSSVRPNVNFFHLWDIKKIFLEMFLVHIMKVNGVQNKTALDPTDFHCTEKKNLKFR